MNFRRYLTLVEYVLSSDGPGAPVISSDQDTHGAAPYRTPNDFTRPDSGGTVPQAEMGLPSVTRRAMVVRLDYHKRLIEIQLADRTILYMTRDQFDRVGGDPVVPNRSILTVTFQQNPTDRSRVPSQVSGAFCEAVPEVRQSAQGR